MLVGVDLVDGQCYSGQIAGVFNDYAVYLVLASNKMDAFLYTSVTLKGGECVAGGCGSTIWPFGNERGLILARRSPSRPTTPARGTSRVTSIRELWERRRVEGDRPPRRGGSTTESPDRIPRYQGAIHRNGGSAEQLAFAEALEIHTRMNIGWEPGITSRGTITMTPSDTFKLFQL